jgi:hypothetical protein
MRVMPLCHPGIGMAEISGDDGKRSAGLQKVRGIGVPQNVETRPWIYSRPYASLPKSGVLVSRPQQAPSGRTPSSGPGFLPDDGLSVGLITQTVRNGLELLLRWWSQPGSNR